VTDLHEQGHALVDGRLLHWVAAGVGQPTVVLEAGLTAALSEWSSLLPRLAMTTRVLASSRAGYGESTPVPTRRSAHDSVRDLEAILDQAGVDGPLILVGHSWGGALVRLYAAEHPDRVAAVVLVDATHEGIAMMRRRRMSPLGAVGMTIAARRARSGKLRASLDAFEGPLGEVLSAVPLEYREAAVEELCRVRTWEQARRDFPAVPRLLRELLASPLPPLQVPVVAVVGGKGEGKEAKSRAIVRAAYEEWLPTQPHGRLVIAPNSGHLVPQQDEDLLLAVITDLVTQHLRP
jgi:pimeloyl-ACP methyl ester carboxylesterase